MVAIVAIKRMDQRRHLAGGVRAVCRRIPARRVRPRDDRGPGLRIVYLLPRTTGRSAWVQAIMPPSSTLTLAKPALVNFSAAIAAL